jgi:predicted ATPase
LPPTPRELGTGPGKAATGLLFAAALAGCADQPQACTEVAALTVVAVDTTALDLPTGATARVCLDEECTDVRVGAHPAFPHGVWWERAIPDVETVQVAVTLYDPTGTELWSAGAPVDTEVALPNGPGCGEWTVLPELTATADGRLTA